ncbi:MAG: hypothetical protein HKN05_03280 [Rhizobiales bacterium]|nr:hypothetical protein [Hyphomicrobiales bacterium]
MRASFLAAVATVVWVLLSGPTTAQEKNSILEGAQKFCAAEYGDRLLGVSIEGENGFACRFAAVEKVATYKVAPAEPKPKWDLDEEDEPSATAAKAAAATSAAKSKAKAKAKLRKKRHYKRAKLRKRKRLQRKRKTLRKKKSDPFAEFMRKVREATRKKRSSVDPLLAPRDLIS